MNKVSDTLYHSQFNSEIYSLVLDDYLQEESSIHSRVEWCQDPIKRKLQKSWSRAVEDALQVASLVQAEILPDELSAVAGAEGDIR